MTAKVSHKGDMTVLGSDEIRIEEGPLRVTEKATAELLHDDNTAKHYYAGVRDMEFFDAEGSAYAVPAVGKDALGNAIKIGKEMTYLDHGGNKRPSRRALYIYQRRDIDPTVPVTDDEEENPHFVPEHVRKGALLVKDDTPPNRTHYTYIFDEIGMVEIADGSKEARDAAMKEALEIGHKAMAESD